MDKTMIFCGVGIAAGILLTSRFVSHQKKNRPTLETINDFHLYDSQKDSMQSNQLLSNITINHTGYNTSPNSPFNSYTDYNTSQEFQSKNYNPSTNHSQNSSFSAYSSYLESDPFKK